MVTSEVSQLSGECNAWRESLRKYRDEFTRFNEKLLDVSRQQTDKDTLLEIEHLQNQFHIQLINIHDLRHQIKSHDRSMALQKAANNGRVPDGILSAHENLYDEVQQLENLLQEVKDKFSQFLAQMN